MIRSMTGFGQAERTAGGIRIQIDMKSVNHRYGETVFRMPREWLVYEDRLRKLIASRIKRGRVDVFVTAERSEGAPAETQIDWSLADAYIKASQELAARYALGGSLTITDLLALPGLVQSGSKLGSGEAVEPYLSAAVEEALEQLCRMRELEGANLLADLRQRLTSLGEYAARTAELAPQAAEAIRSRLRQRMAELLSEAGADPDEQRLLAEAALISERSNIDEEITRLRSHLGQLSDLLADEDAVGRKLDFLIQEMNREINTIGSKAGQTELIGLVVEMKAELEKMREQVQNIE